jgi:hypothetical protein
VDSAAVMEALATAKRSSFREYTQPTCAGERFGLQKDPDGAGLHYDHY